MLCPVSQVLLLQADGSIADATRARAVGYCAWENPLAEDSSSVPRASIARSTPRADSQHTDGERAFLLLRSGRLEYPHHTWGAPGQSAFDTFCRSLSTEPPTSELRTRRVLFRPHHADVLSDIQRCLAFVRDEVRRREDGFGLVFDPIGLLAPSMRASAADHLARWADVVADAPGFELLIVRALDDVSGPEADPEAPFSDQPLGADHQDAGLLRPLLEAWVGSGRSILIPARGLAALRALLASWGIDRALEERA